MCILLEILTLKFEAMKKILFTLLILAPFITKAQGAFGEIIGTVINADSMYLSHALVYTESNGTIYKDLTDMNGKFRISAVPAGKYLFSIVAEGDTMKNIPGEITMEGIENLNTITFEPTGDQLTQVNVIYNRDEIHLLKYGVTPVIKMSADQIKRSPNKFNQAAMIASMSSDIKIADDGQLIFRGARKGDMIYMMDGVKQTGISNVPSCAIGEMMVYTGGIPAKYGDTTGGVVVMETKSYFDLYREWKSTQNK
jgi:hypothetical protein